MWRFLFGGAAVLAGLLYLFLSEGAGPGKQVAQSRVDDLRADSVEGGEREVSTTSAPLALRMRSESGEIQPGDSSAAASAGKLSMSAAFAAEAPGDEPLRSEREDMIRRVVSDLLAGEVGAVTIGKLECREQHCLLQLGGEEEAALFELIGALQDERGFLGKSEGMMLARDADGFAVYLRFAEVASGAHSPTSAGTR